MARIDLRGIAHSYDPDVTDPIYALENATLPGVTVAAMRCLVHPDVARLLCSISCPESSPLRKVA